MKRVLQTIVRDNERYSISNSSELSISKADLYIEKIELQGGAMATTDDIVVTRSGKNLFDWSAVKSTQIVIEENGRKIIMPIRTESNSNGYTSTLATFRQLFPRLKAGDTATLSFNSNAEVKKIYIHTVNVFWASGQTMTVTEDMLDCIVAFYGNYYAHGQTEQVIISDFQMELGTTATAYEPYLPPKSLTFSRDYLLSLKGANNLVYMIMPTITKSGITFTNNGDGTITVDGTATAKSIFYFCGELSTTGNLLLLGCPSGGSNKSYYLGAKCYDNEGGLYYLSDFGNGGISKKQISKFTDIYIVIQKGNTVSNLVFKPELYDLTAIYGEGNEPTTVEQFLKTYPLSSTDKLTITKNSVKYNDTDITSEVTGLDEFFGIDANVSTITTSANIALGEITEDISYSVKSNKRAIYTGENIVYSSQTFIKE